MGYAPSTVVLFCAHNRHLVGDNAPHIIARAYRQPRLGPLFTSGAVGDVFGDMAVAQMFMGIAQADPRYIMLGFGQTALTIDILLLALFGGLPRELQHFVQGKAEEDEIDIYALMREAGNLLRARGVDWEDSWFIPESAAPEDATENR